MVRIKKGYAEYLGGFPWQFWVTPTFREHPTNDRAAGVYPHYAVRRVKRYIRDLERRSQRGINYLWVQDFGGLTGRLHFHMLVGNCGNLTKRDVADAWQDGRIDVARYTPGRGAHEYLAAKLPWAQRGIDWDLNVDPVPSG